MATGFRKSLFGFNCEDVMAYIESTHNSFSKKQNELNEEIKKSTDELKAERVENERLIEEINRLREQLKEYTDKQEYVEQLSKNIGKLYLVAQSNAKAILDRANALKQASMAEVDKNITSIDNAHSELDSAKEKIAQLSSDFAASVESLTASLDIAKNQITENEQEDNKAQETFEKIYNSVNL